MGARINLFAIQVEHLPGCRAVHHKLGLQHANALMVIIRFSEIVSQFLTWIVSEGKGFANIWNCPVRESNKIV